MPATGSSSSSDGSILYFAVAAGVAAPLGVVLLIALVGGVCYYKKRQRALQYKHRPWLSINDVATYLGGMHSVTGFHATQVDSPVFDHP
jgi:hypothetical protein